MFHYSIRISTKMRQCSSSSFREISENGNDNNGDNNGCLTNNNTKGNGNKNRIIFNRWVTCFNNNNNNIDSARQLR